MRRDYKADLAFLGNYLPDREARFDEFFLQPARLLPDMQFLVGGSGWDDVLMPPNVRKAGHVYSTDHNALNCSARMVLNINRNGMARCGYSPRARIFEAAGAGTCVVTDHFAGLDTFFEPGREILVARYGRDVAEHLQGLFPRQVRTVGCNALRRVLADHTYSRRVRLLEEAVVDAMRRRGAGFAMQHRPVVAMAS